MATDTLPAPRPYQGLADLEAARQVLIAGRRSGEPTHYVHVGDLSWWLFYLNQEFDLHEHLYLWEGADGAPLGWALLSPNYRAFDVFAMPGGWESGRTEAMLRWAEDRMAEKVLAAGGDTLLIYWVAEGDTRLRDYLARRGFHPNGNDYVHTEQSLEGELPAPSLPPGFIVRGMRGMEDAAGRAAAGHAAFQSSRPLELYTERYCRFMASPVYTPELDIVVEAPGGRIAAFCIAWTDEINRVGQLEPVGVHPDFQRQGLGRAVVREALRRLRARGMTRACVGYEVRNPAARALYLGSGFVEQYRILSYSHKLKEG